MAVLSPPPPQVEMKLTILSSGEPDFGKYSCVAKNPRGQTDGSITLYGGYSTATVGKPCYSGAALLQ